MGCRKRSSKREVYSNTMLPQETRKSSNRLTLHLNQQKKRRQKKISGRKEIIKIWAEISEKETKETIVKNNKTKSWFFENINKIDKPLARLIKREKKEKNQINKIINEKGEVTTDNAELHSIIKDYYEQLYGNKIDNLEEMDRFLEKFNLPRLNQEEIEIMNQLQALKLKLWSKIFQKTEAQDQMTSQENSIKHLEKS